MSIETRFDHGTLVMTMARADKRNALSMDMYDGLAQGLQRGDLDRAVRAIVITGAAGHFTAGNDLQDFLQQPPPAALDWSKPPLNFMRALLDCEKPVIAAVTGHAVGIGATMLLHCDLVYLADDARVTMPFVNLGLVPEYASSVLLPLTLGRALASAKLLLGEPITPAEAAAAGMATAVLPAAQVLPRALQAAQRFNQLSPGAVRDSKRLLRQHLRAAIAAAIESESKIFGERLAGAEAREALQAFFEKRAPDFSRF